MEEFCLLYRKSLDDVTMSEFVYCPSSVSCNECEKCVDKETMIEILAYEIMAVAMGL